MSDVICLDKIPEYSCDIPRVKVNPNEKWIKHVHCEGARFHVVSYLFYDGGYPYTQRCSEPDCIVNKPTGVSK